MHWFILRFLNWQAAAIKQVDPKYLVSVGVSNPRFNTDKFGDVDHYSDSCLIKAGGKPTVTIWSFINFIIVLESCHVWECNLFLLACRPPAKCLSGKSKEKKSIIYIYTCYSNWLNAVNCLLLLQGVMDFYQFHSYSWEGKFVKESPFLVTIDSVRVWTN